MALPYYVSPEQMMADKAEYAKKGIAKGRSIVAMEYADGVLLVADNPSASLHKISEMYDRIAFSGAGKYNEFEMLRKAGIRHADLKGYTYSREDVTARSLANAYSQSIGSLFSADPKPLEVELLVVEVGQDGKPNELYRISYDGSIIDEKGVAAIGGKADALLTFLKARWTAPTIPLREALRLSIEALDTVTNQKLGAEGLEGAVLDRTRTGRTLRRNGAAARGGSFRRDLHLQEQHGLPGQHVRLPREFPDAAGRGFLEGDRAAHSLLRHAADLRRRRQGPQGLRQGPALHLPAGPAHPREDVVVHDLVPQHHQHPRRAPRRRGEIPPAPHHRRRFQHVGDRDLPEGRDGRAGPLDDRGRLHRLPHGTG